MCKEVSGSSPVTACIYLLLGGGGGGGRSKEGEGFTLRGDGLCCRR